MQSKTGNPPKTQQRRDKQAAQLRANLHRRKEQARERDKREDDRAAAPRPRPPTG